MDLEYLQHIETSPYVDEGFSPADLKAKGAGLAQRLGNVIPSEQPYQTPKQAQLLSYFNTFIGEIKNILQEFSVGPTSPAERLKRMQLSDQEKASVDALTALYEKLVPSVFPAGWSPQARGTMAKTSTLHSPNISLQQAMKHAIKEAWPGRAWARGKGEAAGIIQKYIAEIKAAYDKFLKNVAKLYPESPKTPDLLSRIVKRNVPQTTDQMAAVEDYISKAEPQVPSAEPAKQAAPAGAPSAPAASQTDAPPKQATPEQQTADDFAFLVSKAIEIINRRVKEDEAHSATYFTKPIQQQGKPTSYHLPSSLEEPHPTLEPWKQHYVPGWTAEKPEGFTSPEDFEKFKKTGYYTQDPKTKQWKYNQPEPGEIEPLQEAEPTDQPKKGKQKKQTSDEPFEPTGKFVYDFAALWDKHRTEWSIEATKGGGAKIQLPSGKTKIIRVFWTWQNTHQNIITVASRDEDSDKWERRDILKFYDHQVHPGTGYDFDIKKFVGQEDPNAASLIQKAKNPQVLDNLEAQVEIAKPAFYALIRRKGEMEFKAEHKDKYGLQFIQGSLNPPPDPNSGKLLYGRGKHKGETISMGHVLAYANFGDPEGTSKEEWMTALKNLGYFEKVPKAEETYEAIRTKAGETTLAFMKVHTDADPIVVNTLISAIGQSLGAKFLDYSPEQLVEMAVKKASSENTSFISKSAYKVQNIKAAADAVLAIIELSKGKGKPIGAVTATAIIQKIVDAYGPNLKAEDYIKLALKSGGEPEQSATSTHSDPTPEPSTIHVQPNTSTTTTPTGPVSKEPEKKAEPNVGSVKFDDKGVVHWTKPDGTLRKFTPKQINNMASPRLMIALKNAGYPFEKFGVKLKEDLNEEFVNPFNLANLL